MQEWTRWFREKQEAYGTIEDFARASGIKVRSVSDYRAGRIPRGPARAAIASVLGDSGPLPGRPSERIATLEERVVELEFITDGLPEGMHALIYRVSRLERVALNRASDQELLELEAELREVLGDDQDSRADEAP